MFPCFFLSVFGVFAFLAARVSASRLSLRVFSSLWFNSIKISKRPPGLVFPGGRLCAWRACGCFPPRLLFGGEELRHVRGVAGLREAFGGVDGLRVDAAGRFYRDNGEDVTCVSGADVARWDGGGDSMVDIIDGGGEYALNADGGHARVLSGVNGGVVGGRFRGVSVCGCRLDEVTGDARLNDVGDYRREDASAPVSRINVMSGNARVLRLAAGCHVGSVTGRSKVMKVNGSVGVVSGSGVVASVLAGGRVGAVVDDGSVSHVEGDGATVCVVGGGQSGAARDGVVRSVAGGARVETVLGRGEVVEVGDGGVVDSVDGEGNVRRVLAGGLVDAVVGHASVDDNGGVIGFLGSPVMPPARDDGARGARLVRNRDGGRVEVVRCGGRVKVSEGVVDRVSSGGVVDSLSGGGAVGSLSGRVGRVEGGAARVENMSGRADAWAEIGVVDYFATARRERGNPVVGRLGPYSRVHFESHNAREVLACIGRVDVGALEAGLVDVTYGSRRESLLPLLRERGGVVE